MSIYIEDYSTKCFVLRGDTKPAKEEIKKIGGKFNSTLTDKTTQERFAAWMFPMNKKDEIKVWLNTYLRQVDADICVVAPNSRYSPKDSDDRVLQLLDLMIKEGMIKNMGDFYASELGIWYDSQCSEGDLDEDSDQVPAKRLLS